MPKAAKAPPPPPSPTRKPLTAYYWFVEHARAPEGEAGPSSFRPTMKEVLGKWKALSEQERREWEEKALAEQKAFFGAAREKAAAELDGDDAADDDDDDGPRKGYSEEVDELATLELPISRVARLMKLNKDVLKTSKDAHFAMAKTTQFFAERCVKEAAAGTARQGRKTVYMRDLVASMKNNPNPEAMQVFVEEFEAPPPKEDAKKPKKKSAVKREAKATGKKRGRPSAKDGADEDGAGGAAAEDGEDSAAVVEQ